MRRSTPGLGVEGHLVPSLIGLATGRTRGLFGLIEAMKTYYIATIPGDGIGKEVIPAG